MSKYILENAAEFECLEKQSQNKFYDYESELKDFAPKNGALILDAGCGSGVVSRYLAQNFPLGRVLGCDASGDRIQQASALAKNIPNLDFKQVDLLKTGFESSAFDSVVCRYVLEHLKNDDAKAVLVELHRCLRPGGTACVIDIDGYLYNVSPKTEFIDQCFLKIKAELAPDFNIGRQIPKMISDAGFTKVQWRIETMQFQGEELKGEIEMIQERFQQAMQFLEKVLGDADTAGKFVEQYLDALRSPYAVLFYNKFIVTAEKQV
jgi:ubiquinone/menaquinone biosynthesis C-methylase UbiE